MIRLPLLLPWYETPEKRTALSSIPGRGPDQPIQALIVPCVTPPLPARTHARLVSWRIRASRPHPPAKRHGHQQCHSHDGASRDQMRVSAAADAQHAFELCVAPACRIYYALLHHRQQSSMGKPVPGWYPNLVAMKIITTPRETGPYGSARRKLLGAM